ncbi:hypothetical protein L1987_18798 [Smallanthus sonchifolius]|uniref:Uncharacterized protein n=1 Tax=Smallanthus sonchifolius TaxID=185202 RepID=A0ACB9J1R8_9ASTR|nr:hypothetical protein L1987_18798 [Smallanthus sonchifolius]
MGSDVPRSWLVALTTIWRIYGRIASDNEYEGRKNNCHGVPGTNSDNGAENISDPHTHSTYGVLWKLYVRQVANLKFQNIGQTGLLSQPLTFNIPLSLTILSVMDKLGLMLKRMPKKPNCGLTTIVTLTGKRHAKLLKESQMRNFMLISLVHDMHKGRKLELFTTGHCPQIVEKNNLLLFCTRISPKIILLNGSQISA